MRKIFHDCPSGLVAARRGGTDPHRYVVPPEEDREAIRDLAAALARSEEVTPEARELAARARFAIEDVPEAEGAVLARELPEHRRGGGAYLFRLVGRPRLVVQAPHTFFDEGTLPLACELFTRSRATALFIETAHRYKAAEIDDRGEHPADVAHAPTSLFQAATEGVLRVWPKTTVVQLHGFALRATGAAVILSSGARVPGDPLVERTKEALAALLPRAVWRFPEETTELGATENVQGRIVRAAGGRFLHVELGAALRKQLIADKDLRARFLDALGAALDDGG